MNCQKPPPPFIVVVGVIVKVSVVGVAPMAALSLVAPPHATDVPAACEIRAAPTRAQTCFIVLWKKVWPARL